jgi:hypothetical protein
LKSAFHKSAISPTLKNMVRHHSRDATAVAGLTRPYHARGSARSPGHFPASILSAKSSARRISGARANNSVPRCIKAAAIGTFEVRLSTLTGFEGIEGTERLRIETARLAVRLSARMSLMFFMELSPEMIRSAVTHHDARSERLLSLWLRF